VYSSRALTAARSGFAFQRRSAVKQFAVALSLFTLVLFAGVSAAAAQEAAPAAESSVDYTFGQELRFNLQVDDASGIQRLTLYFRPELSSNVYEVEVPFPAGDTISVTQPVDVSKLDIRPYSDVDYFWEIDTAQGIETLPESTFTYEDDRFPWQAMIRNGTTAHWSGFSPQFGQSVLDTTEQALSSLLKLIPLEEVDPIDIYVYPSTADIRSALQLAGLDDSEFDQRELGVMLIASVNEGTALSDLEYVVPYELAHLLLHRVAGERIDAIPWWLREGIAENARLNSNPRDEQLLMDALAANDTIPLWRLCDTPQGPAERLELAAVQSASIVRYLEDSQPAGTASNLLSAYISGDACEQGVNRVLNSTLDELEDQWLDGLQEPTAVQNIARDAAPWILLLLGSSVLVAIIILANRRKG
jgi:hypothetical protein